MRELGHVVRLQIQRSSLKTGEKPHRVYDPAPILDRKSTRLNSSHGYISYAVFCLKKKKKSNISKHKFTRYIVFRHRRSPDIHNYCSLSQTNKFQRIVKDIIDYAKLQCNVNQN